MYTVRVSHTRARGLDRCCDLSSVSNVWRMGLEELVQSVFKTSAPWEKNCSQNKWPHWYTNTTIINHIQLSWTAACTYNTSEWLVTLPQRSANDPISLPHEQLQIRHMERSYGHVELNILEWGLNFQVNKLHCLKGVLHEVMLHFVK